MLRYLRVLFDLLSKTIIIILVYINRTENVIKRISEFIHNGKKKMFSLFSNAAVFNNGYARFILVLSLFFYCAQSA